MELCEKTRANTFTNCHHKNDSEENMDAKKGHFVFESENGSDKNIS